MEVKKRRGLVLGSGSVGRERRDGISAGSEWLISQPGADGHGKGSSKPVTVREGREGSLQVVREGMCSKPSGTSKGSDFVALLLAAMRDASQDHMPVLFARLVAFENAQLLAFAKISAPLAVHHHAVRQQTNSPGVPAAFGISASLNPFQMRVRLHCPAKTVREAPENSVSQISNYRKFRNQMPRMQRSDEARRLRGRLQRFTCDGSERFDGIATLLPLPGLICNACLVG